MDTNWQVDAKGLPGQQLSLQLLLRVVADVGIVGFPNAGAWLFVSRVCVLCTVDLCIVVKPAAAICAVALLQSAAGPPPLPHPRVPHYSPSTPNTQASPRCWRR